MHFDYSCSSISLSVASGDSCTSHNGRLCASVRYILLQADKRAGRQTEQTDRQTDRDRGRVRLRVRQNGNCMAGVHNFNFIVAFSVAHCGMRATAAAAAEEEAVAAAAAAAVAH